MGNSMKSMKISMESERMFNDLEEKISPSPSSREMRRGVVAPHVAEQLGIVHVNCEPRERQGPALLARVQGAVPRGHDLEAYVDPPGGQVAAALQDRGDHRAHGRRAPQDPHRLLEEAQHGERGDRSPQQVPQRAARTHHHAPGAVSVAPQARRAGR